MFLKADRALRKFNFLFNLKSKANLQYLLLWKNNYIYVTGHSQNVKEISVIALKSGRRVHKPPLNLPGSSFSKFQGRIYCAGTSDTMRDPIVTLRHPAIIYEPCLPTEIAGGSLESKKLMEDTNPTRGSNELTLAMLNRQVRALLPIIIFFEFRPLLPSR